MKKTEQPSPFEKEIQRADKQLRQTQISMEAVKQKHESGEVYEAYIAAFDFADAAEKLVFMARQLPAYTGNPHAVKKSVEIIKENIPVKIGFTPEGWFGVIIPALLPKKQKGSAEYLRDALYMSMQNFFRGKQPVKYTDCVLIFRHVYRHDMPERQYRDHDNIEVNMVADAIALYVLYDDSALRCSHFYCSTPGDENRTEIFVVPQSEFVVWILDAKSHKSKAVILHENIPKNTKKHM
jgi:hypothetical protein